MFDDRFKGKRKEYSKVPLLLSNVHRVKGDNNQLHYPDTLNHSTVDHSTRPTYYCCMYYVRRELHASKVVDGAWGNLQSC